MKNNSLNFQRIGIIKDVVSEEFSYQEGKRTCIIRLKLDIAGLFEEIELTYELSSSSHYREFKVGEGIGFEWHIDLLSRDAHLLSILHFKSSRPKRIAFPESYVAFSQNGELLIMKSV